MKIHLVNPYGNLPDEGWFPYRSSCLAEQLGQRGHEVVWWTSNLEHREKRPRHPGKREYGRNFTVNIVKSLPYRKHVSLARIKFERTFARNVFKVLDASPEKPDVIVQAEPAVCYADIAVRYYKKRPCPLVIDVIDLWPELFRMLLPQSAKGLEKFVLGPLYGRRRRLLECADGFMAVSKDYLRVANVEAPGRPGIVAYLGIDVGSFSKHKGSPPCLPEKQPGDIWCIYVGTLGKNYDISCLLEAAQRLVPHRVKILIAGAGDRRGEVEEAARRGLVIFLDTLTRQELIEVYRQCDLGLAPYAEGSTVAMPFKAFDYLAAGLPIVTSIKGELGEMLESNSAGAVYEAGAIQSLLSAILKYAANADARQRASLASRALADEMDYAVQYSNAADFIERVGRSATDR
jgi:glycosyltransferase involved in cell wall biosynthesis